MTKKILTTIFLALALNFALPVSSAYAGNFLESITSVASEKYATCERLKNSPVKPFSEAGTSGGGVIPDEVLTSIFNTTKSISDSVMLISILGDTLMCHASHAAKNQVTICGIKLFDYPDISIWLCGAIIYFFGFMLVISICFYVVDISFKLGFAIILLPVGIALWPFAWTKDKLVALISIFLKSAAIFAFLAVTVAFTLGMLSVSLGGLRNVFDAIQANNTDLIAETFTLDASTALLVLTSLAYGMKLIGTSVNEYANKFFPDKAFGGASPMHHLSTQAMDFAKQKVVQPVASLAHDIAKTQAGKLTEGAGNLLQGKYHQQIKSGLQSGIRNIGVAIRNPKEIGEKLGVKAAQKITAGLGKAGNTLKYGAHMAAASVLIGGKQNRADLREQLRKERDLKNQNIDARTQQAYQQAMAPINQAISQNEAARAAEKQAQQQQKQADRQQWHAEHMTKDPVYRAGVAGLQKVKGGIQQVESGIQKAVHGVENIDANRRADIGTMSDKIDDLNDRKEASLIKTAGFDKGVDKIANAIANGGKITNWYRQNITGKLDSKIAKREAKRQKLHQRIDTGRFAAKDTDILKAPIKYALRSAQKLAVDVGFGIRQAPTKLLSAVTKAPTVLRRGVVNTVAAVTKTGADGIAGVGNVFVRGYYDIQKVPTGVKRAVWRAPDVIKGVWKIPGLVLEKTGHVMQDNRPPKKK